MELGENEMHLFKVRDPRTESALYFRNSREAWRVAEECSMDDPVRELFNTDYPMPPIEDMGPNDKLRGATDELK